MKPNIIATMLSPPSDFAIGTSTASRHVQQRPRGSTHSRLIVFDQHPALRTLLEDRELIESTPAAPVSIYEHGNYQLSRPRSRDQVTQVFASVVVVAKVVRGRAAVLHCVLDL